MKTNFLLFTAIIILLSVFACNQSGNQMTGNQIASNETSAKKRIGVSLLTREDDFYRELETGLQEAARQNNFELLIQSGDKDLSKQQSQIDNFLVQKVDAIIVCPTDTQGIAPAIERANAASIPVFTADIAAGGGKIVSHVASDNVAGGRLAAAEGRGKTNLVIVGYDAAPEAVAKIRAGTALKADVAQQPRDIGAKTIEAIAKHFKGEPVEAKVAVPVKIVDAESAK